MQKLLILSAGHEPSDGIDVHGAQRAETLSSLFHVDVQTSP